MGKSSNKSAAPAVVAPEVVVSPANAGLVPKQGATKAKNKPPPNKAESEEDKEPAKVAHESTKKRRKHKKHRNTDDDISSSTKGKQKMHRNTDEDISAVALSKKGAKKAIKELLLKKTESSSYVEALSMSKEEEVVPPTKIFSVKPQDDSSDSTDEKPPGKKRKVDGKSAEISKKDKHKKHRNTDEDSSALENVVLVSKKGGKKAKKTQSNSYVEELPMSKEEETTKEPSGKPVALVARNASEKGKQESSSSISKDETGKAAGSDSSMERNDGNFNKHDKYLETPRKIVSSATESQDQEPKTPTSYQRPPASGGKTLYVGNIFGADRDQLNQFFRNVAKVSHIGLPAHEDSQPKDSTYVTFASVGEAEKALQLNGKDFLGRAVIIERPSQGGASAQGTRHGGSFGKSSGGPGLEVIVKGFDQSKRENDVRSALQEHFSGCGVTRMRVLMDYTTDTNKGMAFMDCPDKSSFNKTLELDGTYLDGKILRVAEANSKEQPGGASGGGRRGSGDWSGGRFGRGSDDWSGGRFGRGSGDWSGDRFGRRSGDWSGGRFGRGYGDLSGGRFSPYDSRGS